MPIKDSLNEIINSKYAQENMSEKEIKILCAAIEIFSEKGFQATTTNEIAKKANVAEGTIFRYYKTKKDLLLAIPACLAYTTLPQNLLQAMTSVIDQRQETLEEFLRALIENRRNFAIENIAILKVLVQEIPFHPELRETIIKTILSPILGRLMIVIDSFKERGQIINMPTEQIIRLLFSTVFGYFFSKYIVMLDLHLDNANEVEELIQFIMNGIATKEKPLNNL